MLTKEKIIKIFNDNTSEHLKDGNIKSKFFKEMYCNYKKDMWFIIAEHLVTCEYSICSTDQKNFTKDGDFQYPLQTDITAEGLLDNTEEDIIDFIRSGAKLENGIVVIYN